jgi:type I restriction enzyme S subunit
MDKEEKQLVREIKNYKIPQDWHKYEMGKLFNFSGGLSFSRNNLSDRGFPYLHYGDIHTSRKNYLNVKNEMNVLPKLNIPLNDVKKESLLKHGDVVFVDASEDYEGTSKCVVIENSKNVPFVSGLHTIIAKSKDEIVRNNYKKFCYQKNIILHVL